MSKNFSKRHGKILKTGEKIRKKIIGKTSAPKKKKFVLSISLAVLVAGCITLFEYSYADTFYPGVFIGDVSVGGKTFDEVNTYFNDRAKILTDNGLHITLMDGSPTKEIKIPISSQGLTPDKSFEYFSLGDWKKTVKEAYGFGRTGSSLQRTWDQIRLLPKHTFALPSNLYEISVDSFVSHELDLFLKKPVPAQFSINKNGEISVTPERSGERIDKRVILDVLKKKVASFDPSPETFKTEMVTPLTTAKKLAPHIKFADFLSKKTELYFQYKTYRKQVRGTTLVSWLAIKNEDAIGIDDAKLSAFLSGIAPVIENPPQNSRFEIIDGRLKEIVLGKPGNIVDVAKTGKKLDESLSEIQKSLKAGAIIIEIETITGEPRATQKTVDEYHINELVGISKTNFKGSSADRITNITAGASRLNGRLIAPDEEFSTVEAIGYVGAEYGFVKEYVIKDNKSIKEFGGGLCQVATTLFRSALNAGLPITERASHRYVVGYYGPGLDATIYGPHPDLRFANDTGEYLLLQARVSGTELIIEFYGQKDGRKVTISEPILSDKIPAPVTKYIPTNDLRLGDQKCSEMPRQGVTADVDYEVTFTDGKVNKQHFTSIYEPWQKICLLGIGR